MSLGLVYLRPLRLAGIDALSASEEEIQKSWELLNRWITRKSLSRDIEIGYGLLQHSALQDGTSGSSYEACIEVPKSVTTGEAGELKRSSLPGGAYFRRRCSGPVASMLGELQTMRSELDRRGNVKIDLGRPIVTVLLDIKQLRSGDGLRSNLLIPARSSEMSCVSNQVA
ncbi:MAG: GyrI-like domain-containing protein [Filomicrobium sp.]